MSTPVITTQPHPAFPSRFARHYEAAVLARPSHHARRHEYKQAAICLWCVYGQHEKCGLLDCGCVHRENEPRI